MNTEKDTDSHGLEGDTGLSHPLILLRASVSPWCIPLLLSVLCVSAVKSFPERASSPRRVTTDGLRKEDLAWSPDGKRLACSYYHEPGRIAIALLDPTGGANPRLLTKDPVERSPAWSPDGTHLVFVHVTQSGTDGELDIHQMDLEGNDRKPLMATKGAFENFPSLSPDGKRLLYTTTRDKTQEIYVADADGGNPKRLTSDSTLKQYPGWSPDGKQIVFNANRDGNFDIYVMDADGTHVRRLTDDPAMDVCPRFSPNGKHIAWVSMRDTNPEVYVMDADGSHARNVSQYPGYDHFPAWMPDGKTLTWVSDRDGRYDVYALTMP